MEGPNRGNQMQLEIFRALCTLAAEDGRREALFGDCEPLAREAFLRSPSGGEFPLLWFEVPLAGQPRFDLHVALSRKSLQGCTQFFPDAESNHNELFRWYVENETGGNGLALAYDISEGRIDDPAIHVNVNGSSLENMDRFFDLAAGEGAYARYLGFESRIPQGWRIWYAGVHPGRPGAPVRVDCFVDEVLKSDYATDMTLFERDLRACGFTAASPALRDLAAPILRSPFRLELQFDVMGDGSLGPTVGVSAGFPFVSSDAVRRLFGDGGEGGKLMTAIEGMGLSDERWRYVPDAAFSKLVQAGDAARAFYCVPTFVKLRMRNGEPLDAKFYLQAGAPTLS